MFNPYAEFKRHPCEHTLNNLMFSVRVMTYENIAHNPLSALEAFTARTYYSLINTAATTNTMNRLKARSPSPFEA